jgi:DNA primase catalytic core
VWDVSQTTGRPLPEAPRPRLLTGQAPHGLWDALTDQIAAAGFTVHRGDCGTANGLTDPATHTVRVRPDLDDAQAVKTLAHELAHVHLHVREPRLAECRGTVEVEAESVAYLVIAAHGLDTSGYTFPYVTGWADQVPGKDVEDVVRATGQRVVAAAHAILDATSLMPDTDDARRARALADRAQAAANRTGQVRVRAVRKQASTPAPTPTPARTHPVTRAELLAVHEQAASFFRQHLAGSWVPDYLQGRGLDTALDPSWGAGYAPASWTGLIDHLRSRGVDNHLLLASGLATPARTGRLIDRFRDRVVFPLRSADGDVIAFIGRSGPDADPDRVPRYLNSPGTAIFAKGEHLFGLFEARAVLAQRARPVLVEGPLDAVAVTSGTGGRCAGIAPCGTALTTAQVDLLRGHVNLACTRLVVATDSDSAGRQAAVRAHALLERHRIDAQATCLPTGSDPAAVLNTQGGAALTSALIDQAVPLVSVVVDQRIEGWKDRLRWPEGRVGAVRSVAPLIAALPADLAGSEAARVAQRVDIDLSLVHREVVQCIPLSPRLGTHVPSTRRTH